MSTSQVPGRLESKVAIVTGAGSGFGAAIAERFAQEGCRVLIGDLKESAARSTAERIGGSFVRALHMDVCSETDWTAAVETCLRTWGRLDAVVNNAGTSYKNKETLDVTPEEFDRVFNVNVKGVFLSVRAAVPVLKSQGQGGLILNISSVGSTRPRPGLVWYNSSKGAVSNATRGLAAEYGPDQIRVNALCPLLSATGLFEMFTGGPDTPETRQKFLTGVPMGRLTDPMDVANAALFLASDEGKFVTGANLEVDGGRSI
ncbi:oxidoreductase [Lineolata rhizophorae]|uniref:Oxidoreductase n=1 Tax=Lineolata rhizophorae TaxID=578093 RepID=A0A6A6PDX2_9PEZI|nr:oxidoreductase [Lineolata rhizophorae]